ncbi:MAG: DUF3161 domain-containing protein [archaeon]|nr:DUF3161 domain-containing protein [archaeon]
MESEHARVYGEEGVPELATPAALVRRLRQVQAAMPGLKKECDEIAEQKTALARLCGRRLLNNSAMIQQLQASCQVLARDPSGLIGQTELLTEQVANEAKMFLQESDFFFGSSSKNGLSTTASGEKSEVMVDENIPTPASRPTSSMHSSPRRVPPRATTTARKPVVPRNIPAAVTTSAAASIGIPETPSRLKAPVRVNFTVDASACSSPSTADSRRRMRGPDPEHAENARRLSLSSAQRLASSVVIPVSEQEFAGVPSVVRGRVQLEDVNELYCHVWAQTKEAEEPVAFSVKELVGQGMRSMVGKTGEAKLNTLRALKLIEIKKGKICLSGHPFPSDDQT